MMPSPDEADAEEAPGYHNFGREPNLILHASWVKGIGAAMATWAAFLLFLRVGLGYDAVTIGALMGLHMFVSVIMAIPNIWMCRKWGIRKVLILGGSLHTVAFFIFGVFSILPMIVLGTILAGTAQAISMGNIITYGAGKVGYARRKYLTSLMMSLVHFSAFWGLLAGALFFRGWGADHFGWGIRQSYGYIFITASMLHLAYVFIIAMTRDELKETGEPVEENSDIMHDIPKKTLLARFSLPSAVIGTGAGFIVPLFPLYYNVKFQVTDAQIMMLIAVTHLVWSGFQFLVPGIANRWGSLRTIIVLSSLAICCMAMIPLTPWIMGPTGKIVVGSLTLAFLCVSAFHVARMILMNTGHPIWDAFMLSMVDPASRVQVKSWAQFAWGVSNSSATLVAGFILATRNPDMVFVAGSGFYVAYIIILWSWFRNVDEKATRNVPPPTGVRRTS